jgi:hypothetical protein
MLNTVQPKSGGTEELPQNIIATTDLVDNQVIERPTQLSDLAKFRLPQDYAATESKRLLTMVPVRRPSKEVFFRAHPDWEFRAMVLEIKDSGHDTYLVDRQLWEELAGETTVAAKLLIPAVTRQGTVMLWPIRLPDESGRLDDWNRSAIEAMDIAKEKWIRLVPDRALGAYVPRVASNQDGEPKWPEESFEEIIKIAFKHRTIDSLNHAVLRGLRGES